VTAKGAGAELLATFLVPSRRRAPSLLRSIASLAETASRPCFEVAVAFDDDDRASCDEFTGARLPCPIQVVVGPRHGYRGLHRYYNALAERARGEWLVLWNDDCQMLSAGWDDAIRRHAGRFVMLNPWNVDDAEYVSTGHTMFPIVPREWQRVLGHFSQYNHCDDYVGKLARAVGIFQNEFRIRHSHVRLHDEVTAEIRYHVDPMDPIAFEADRLALLAFVRTRPDRWRAWGRRLRIRIGASPKARALKHGVARVLGGAGRARALLRRRR
jgi:hypothetical protein